jgi:hypothetical protein
VLEKSVTQEKGESGENGKTEISFIQQGTKENSEHKKETEQNEKQETSFVLFYLRSSWRLSVFV